MFDTYEINRCTDHYVRSDTTVTVNKAPTDESVRLLKELEKEALNKLISVTKLENNIFKAVWHVYENHINMSKDVYCKFLVNGYEHEIKFSIKSTDIIFDDKYGKVHDYEILAEKVYEKLIKKLSKILTKDLFMTSMQVHKF